MKDSPLLSIILIIIFIITIIYNNKIYITIIFLLHYKQKVPWYSESSFSKEKIPLKYINWMSYIKDSTDIREMSIPGTHDSSTYQFKGYFLFYKNFISQTQSWKIEDQLMCGIRYFDLRPSGNGIIYHGDHETLYSLNSIFQIFQNFLFKYNTECLIVRIQFQYKNCNGDIEGSKERGIYNILDKFNDIIYNNNEVPNMGKIRGKIYLILERLKYKNYIIWDENDILEIQDYYRFWGIRKYEIDKKINLVKDFMYNNNKEKLIINHCSAIGRGVLTTLKYVAYSVNKLPFQEKGFRGIFAFDFPGEELIKHVINQNTNYFKNDFFENNTNIIYKLE